MCDDERIALGDHSRHAVIHITSTRSGDFAFPVYPLGATLGLRVVKILVVKWAIRGAVRTTFLSVNNHNRNWCTSMSRVLCSAGKASYPPAGARGSYTT